MGEQSQPRVLVGPLEFEPTAEGAVEVLERLHGRPVDHLLMEARIGFGWLQSAFHEYGFVVGVDGRIKAAVPTVIIDDLEPGALRSVGQWGFVRDVDRDTAAA